MRKYLEPIGGVVLLALILFGSADVLAQQASFTATGTMPLSWQAPTENVDGTPLTDLAGYKVYVGPSSRNYDQIIDVTDPAATTATVQITVTDLVTEFYVAMTALDADGNESGYSNEVLKTVTVRIDSDPNAPVLMNFDITIDGCVVLDQPGVRCSVTVD
jgi:hypothetical protein